MLFGGVQRSETEGARNLFPGRRHSAGAQRMADELEDFVLTGGQGQYGVGAHGRLPVAVSKNTELPTLAEGARDTVNIYSAGQRRKSIRPMAVCIAPVVLRHPFRWLVRARCVIHCFFRPKPLLSC